MSKYIGNRVMKHAAKNHPKFHNNFLNYWIVQIAFYKFELASLEQYFNTLLHSIPNGPDVPKCEGMAFVWDISD
jgi:hypothetical protein